MAQLSDLMAEHVEEVKVDADIINLMSLYSLRDLRHLYDIKCGLVGKKVSKFEIKDYKYFLEERALFTYDKKEVVLKVWRKGKLILNMKTNFNNRAMPEIMDASNKAPFAFDLLLRHFFKGKEIFRTTLESTSILGVDVDKSKMLIEDTRAKPKARKMTEDDYKSFSRKN